MLAYRPILPTICIGNATTAQEKNIMLDSKDRKEFLYWLSKRLTNKYQEDSEVIKRLNEIIYYTTIVPNCVDNDTIDRISAKYFNTFIERDASVLNDIFGGDYYSDKQEEIRTFVISMIAEVFRVSELSIETEQDEQEQDNHTDEYSFL